MGKKSKKRRLSGAQKTTGTKGQNKPASTTADAPPAAGTGSKSYGFRSKGGAEFNPDYSYVVKDLKRIGILAGSFFAILIALSFFLR